MLYVLPDYYPDFHCVAGECEDTCCAGWQIVIDEKSLKKYRGMPGDISVKDVAECQLERKNLLPG